MMSVPRYAFRTIIAVFASLIFAGCATSPGAPKPAVPSDTAVATDTRGIVVATVNGAPLNMDQLITVMNRLPAKISGPDGVEEHKQRSLDRLILQELAFQQAKAQGLSTGDDKIDMAIANLKANLGEGLTYDEYLKQNNVTEAELRQQIERSLLIEQIYAKEVLKKASVPEDEARAEYEKVKHLYILPEKVSVLDVYILKNDEKAMRKKADELLKKIKAFPDKDPWKLTLDGMFIVRDYEAPEKREPELYRAAKRLRQGGLSGVIKTRDGLHIIKLKEYSPSRQLTFDETKSKLELKFLPPAQEKRTQEWERELRAGAKIELFSEAAGGVQQEQKPAEAGPEGNK